MCGLVGMVAKTDVAPDIYDALTVLQHRGQDAAGIMTCVGGRFSQRKSEGLVRDVFRQNHMQRLQGTMGIGHVRYPTAGSSGPALAQPFYVNSPYGIALAHNGNLTNAEQLARELFQDDLRHLNTDSDSEVLLNVFAHEMQTLHMVLPEHIADQTLAFALTETSADTGHDTRGILPSMLQHRQGIIDIRRDICFRYYSNKTTHSALTSQP